ncbi:Uncharacterized protein DAT39_004308 [Clarias magur]|uniref:Uncharacterized protein n=1 Tax=Clarias magur TaxID=1594786 RepID=A0A8J4X6F7_CLAMG|nr:Uncharacterized protein DAT39_004308 [Clarias magur]
MNKASPVSIVSESYCCHPAHRPRTMQVLTSPLRTVKTLVGCPCRSEDNVG